ncbi:MAG: hypothetical protein LBV50_08830 [Novosphingobium sp.]|jgi:hypothetical protein|nr:hypothetical protein [Novosphingobium sp.]
MSWAEDKQRCAEMGAGPLLLCAFLLLLAAIGIWQAALVWAAGDQLLDAYGTDLDGVIIRYKILASLKVILLVSSAFGLFFSRNKIAIFLAIAALFFASRQIIYDIALAVASNNFVNFAPFRLFDLFAFIVPTTYLLFSSEIERIYHTGTRRFLIRGTLNTWRRLRSRPTLDELEAARLDKTFK